MSVLGYCKVCGKLVNIRPGPTRDDVRQTWYPVPHDDLGGKPCETGPKKGI